MALTNPDELLAFAADIQQAISAGVRGAIETARHIGGIPITDERLQFNLVDAKRLVVIISFPPPSTFFSAVHIAWPQSRYPELASLDEIDEIVKFCRFDDYLSAKFLPDRIDRNMSRSDAAIATEVHFWALTWGRELVEEEIANTRPDFRTAQRRMTKAYNTLFELEHGLRKFIDAPLSKRYKAKKWLLKAYQDPKYQDAIQSRKQDEKYGWIDVLDDSETRFLDFDHMRQLIHANPGVFEALVPDVQAFKRMLEDMRDFRNRIGHVNTLSEDDYGEFSRLARRVMAIIHPKHAEEELP